MIEIIPAILAKDYEDFEEKIKKVEPFVERVQVDVADGIFVPNKTINGYDEIKKVNTKLKFDVHLMVKNPENQMHEWYKTAADRIIIHTEVNHIIKGIAETCHLNGKKIGAAMNPGTSLELLEEFVSNLDFVQFMTVDPGFYGSPFKPEVLGKISEFRERHPEIPIMVDGGVSPKNMAQLAIAGVSTFVVGSYIFGNPNIGEALNDLRKAVMAG